MPGPGSACNFDMNRRNFLKNSIAAVGVLPFVAGNLNAKETAKPVFDRLKLGHQYPGAYHEPNDLFTPEEIAEAGFVFVSFPTFVCNSKML